jgi:RNA polymerase sigma factor (sigma-70 family)
MVIEPPNQELTTPEFFGKNNDLAGRYKLASPSARQNIILELYRLDLKLFQGWRVLGDDREDYQQEAALWLTRALETYKPDKGPFVNWLRGYIQNTFRHHVKTHKKKAEPLNENEEVSDTQGETAHDPLFWKGVKARVTPAEWDLIRLRFHDGKTITEIAKLKGTYAEKIRAPLLKALNTVKVASLSDLSESAKNVSSLDDHQTWWYAPQQIAKLLGFTEKELARITAVKVDKTICPFTIDPRDILRLSRKRLRIRFLETDKGLIYPRFVQRGKVVGRAGYL